MNTTYPQFIHNLSTIIKIITSAKWCFLKSKYHDFIRISAPPKRINDRKILNYIYIFIKQNTANKIGNSLTQNSQGVALPDGIPSKGIMPLHPISSPLKGKESKFDFCLQERIPCHCVKSEQLLILTPFRYRSSDLTPFPHPIVKRTRMPFKLILITIQHNSS